MNDAEKNGADDRTKMVRGGVSLEAAGVHRRVCEIAEARIKGGLGSLDLLRGEVVVKQRPGHEVSVDVVRGLVSDRMRGIVVELGHVGVKEGEGEWSVEPVTYGEQGGVIVSVVHVVWTRREEVGL